MTTWPLPLVVKVFTYFTPPVSLFAVPVTTPEAFVQIAPVTEFEDPVTENALPDRDDAQIAAWLFAGIVVVVEELVVVAGFVVDVEVEVEVEVVAVEVGSGLVVEAGTDVEVLVDVVAGNDVVVVVVLVLVVVVVVTIEGCTK